MSEENGESGNRKLLLILGAVVVAIPVVIVVAMVVLFVLSAVIGTFVLGVGSEQTTVPQASFDFDYDAGTVTVTHAGGDTYDADAVEVYVGGERRGTWSDLAAAQRIEPGSQLRIDDVASGDRIRLVWNGPEGDRSTTVASYQAQ